MIPVYRTLLLLLVLACAPGVASVNVPVSDPIYEYLERLEAFNCAYSTLRVFGPQTHQDLIAAVYVSEDEDRCEAPEWLLKERQILTRPQYPMRLENRTVGVPDDFLQLTGTGTVISPLVPLREGRDTLAGFTSGTEVLLQTTTQAREIGIAAAVRPGWVGFVPQNVGARGNFYLQEGYVKVGYGWSELTYGRVGMRFGQTKHGSLLFSEAAAPMDVLQYRLRPVVPGFAKFLGPLSIQAWWARQDDESLSRGANLAAIQLGLRPFHWLELGWTELFQFGGSGVPALTAGDIGKMLLYLRDERLDQRRSRAMATHVGVWLARRTAKIYAQTLFSDLHSADDFSYLLGLWFPRVGNSQLRFEWVHTGSFPYQQNLFANGLSYERSPLGHSLGADAKGLYADFEFTALDDWRLELGGRYEHRGGGRLAPGAASETRMGGSITARKRWWAMDLELSALYQHAENANHQLGIVGDSFGGSMKFVYTFL